MRAVRRLRREHRVLQEEREKLSKAAAAAPRLFGREHGLRHLAGCFAQGSFDLPHRHQFCLPFPPFGNIRGDQPSLTAKPRATLSARNARRRSLANDAESSG